MNTRSSTLEDRAREYIDSIVAINQKYGMDGNLSEDIYNDAVTAATDAYKNVDRHHESAQPNTT